MRRRSESFAEATGLKKRSLARLSRFVYEVHQSKSWRRSHPNFVAWAKKSKLGLRGALYTYLKIGKYLRSLPEKEINKLGFVKCGHLARLAKRYGFIDKTWLAKAKQMGSTPFKIAVDWELQQRRGKPEEFGEVLDPSFRGLAHAPVNEHGVVYLFGMVSRDLGFRVEKVQQAYPDCIAKQLVSKKPEKWRKVRIEFEYKSSGFDHPREGSDLIICWENDLGRRAPLPVIELKSAIKRLSHR